MQGVLLPTRWGNQCEKNGQKKNLVPEQREKTENVNHATPLKDQGEQIALDAGGMEGMVCKFSLHSTITHVKPSREIFIANQREGESNAPMPSSHQKQQQRAFA